MSVYAKLYDVVAENLQNADMTFGYKKTTFLNDVNSSPQTIDVSKYLELDNEAFLQAVFVAAFKRLPEPKEVEKWNAKIELPKTDFQRLVLADIANSSVVAINHIQLDNNPYFRQNKGLKYKAMGALYGLTDKASLREFGKTLPEPIQKIIRKVFL